MNEENIERAWAEIDKGKIKDGINILNDVLRQTPNDWKVYCVSGGNERIPGLANAMLGKGYTKSEDIKGEVVGKFN